MTTENRSTPLEFWFEFGSNYSYLSVMRIERIAAHASVPIEWRPFLLGPIFKSFGWTSSPFVLQREKGVYVWKDMARQCGKFGIPWRQPSVFPRVALLPMRVATMGAQQPWIGRFCREMMSRNFAADEDIQQVPVVHDVLFGLGLPADALIEGAQSDDVKAQLRARTEEAKARGIFGAPTFFVAGEMFWGNDRLDDAIESARTAHAKGDAP
ncbi:2-hydroxychromene-2-carboxylate isomerase [Methylibium sp.]|uniref:2-hydroxychromene-2-carboxylate isomerase n=1 Tax=Methylibium sp. TaxID=2067992 RepID=UPI0025FC76B9|nr:2-hydroxychromene-2-carboxylate isomerase [Methylibium sp.]